jgi:sugar-specific transcriptional regulator TrmB
MNTQENLVAAGFSEYEARVYLSLLGEHPTTGYQISKNSGVPRSMVYEALGRLHARGAVLKSESDRATYYRPVPPETLLDRFSQEQNSLIDQLRRDLAKRYQPEQGERLWSISGRSAVISYALQMLAEAEREISIVTNDRELLDLSKFIQDCCQRSVGINVLLTGSSQLELDNSYCKNQVAHHPPLESELHELKDLLLVVIDSRECLIAGQGSRSGQFQATVTNNRDLVLIAWQFVWMELFTQRIYTSLGRDLLDKLEPDDRRIFESLHQPDYGK